MIRRLPLLALLLTSSLALALEAPIKLFERGGVARQADPVSVGVPIPRGALTGTDKLCVKDPAGNKIPAQFKVTAWWWPTAKYPDKEKSIRWVLVDFQADVPPNGTAVYRLADEGGNPAPKTPVRTSRRSGGLRVETGPLVFTLADKAFRLFETVELDRQQIVAAAKTDGLCIEGMDGKRYSSAADLRDPPVLTAADYHGNDVYLKGQPHNPPQKLRVTVEEAGPLRTVLLIDGVMQAQSAGGAHSFERFDGAGNKTDPLLIPNRDETLGFRVRIHAYAGKPFVRVFHTIVNLKGKSFTATDQNRYRSAAYIADAIQQPGKFLVESMELASTLKLSGTPRYLFGGDVPHGGEAAANRPVTLYQDSSAGWIWQVAEEKVYDPWLTQNIAYMKIKSGLEKPYHEYSDIHYKILTGQDGCSFMGYCLLEGTDGKSAAAAVGDGKVKGSKASGNRAAGWVDLCDSARGMTAAVRWFWQMYPKALEVDASGRVVVALLPRQWSRGHFMDGKIHRTHEMLYRFHESEDAAATEAAVKAFNKPLVAHCGFDTYLASGACNRFARPDPEKWPNYEGQIRTAVHVGINPKVNTSFDSSYDIEREKEDCFGWEHFGDTAKRGFRGFSQFEEFDSSRCLLMHFMRTGDPGFFETGEELDRWLMGVPCFGGGYGHQHPERSHNWIQGLIDYYHLTGLPEARDAIDVMKGYYEFSKDPKDFAWNYNGRNAAYALNGLRQMFEWTGDPAWLEAANTCIRYGRDKTRAISGFYGGNPGGFMAHVLCHALGRYADLTGDEDAIDWLLGLAGHFKPFSGRCDESGATADCYGWATMLTGDRRYIEAARTNIVDAMAAGPEGPHFRTGDCSSKTWSGAVGGYWQIFFHALNEWKPEDVAPPAAVSDLAAQPGTEPGSAVIAWTNSGDDGAKGTAALIQVKYAPGEIVDFVPWARTGGVEGKPAGPEWEGKVNFWYARNVTGEPAPRQSGTQQSWTIKGLPSGKPLHLAMVVTDEAGNRSKPSNSVSVTPP